jgi:hypothetical protein
MNTDARMIDVPVQTGDDPGFIAVAEAIIRDVVATTQPGEVWRIQIDNWFGDRWLGFFGKLLGIAGVRRKGRLDRIEPHDGWFNTMPPFHPNRVRSETYYRRMVNGRLECPNVGWRVHHRQHSPGCFGMRVPKRALRSVFVWYSGNTLANGRGSLMVHTYEPQVGRGWYLGFVRTPPWAICRHVGISPAAVSGGDLAKYCFEA